MNTEQNKQLIMEAYQLFQRGDIPGVIARCHDDAEWCSTESDSIPFSGYFHGREGIADYFTRLDANVQALRFEPREFLADGDKVVVLGQASWLVKPTGKTIDSPWVHVFTLRDGKVARFELFTDTAAGERAFRADQPGQQAQPSTLHH